MKRFICIISLLVACVTVLVASKVHANLDESVAGQLVADHGGRKIVLPLLQSDYVVHIDGTVATVEVTQSFSNPSDVPLNARYLFPLNQHAAVFAMKMEVGDEIIEAIIQEKEKAQKTFDEAKAEGKAAALLTQHRPNMFTQNIANLMPGQLIKVSLSYVQSVPKIDDRYELVVPMVVSPRFGQSATAQTGDLAGWQLADLPAYPNVAGLNLPKDQVAPRVTLTATVRAGMPILGLGSDSHALTITGNDQAKSLAFRHGAEVDNRDLILRYSLSGDSLQAGVLDHFDADGGYVSITVEPPNIVPDAMATPRELTFLIDTSGSQEGEPLQASQKFMSVALEALRPSDFFRIVQFESSVTSFSKNAVKATPENIQAGQRFVSKLAAGGGTDIDTAIRAAFEARPITGTLPIVVFLSDGLVGNEADVIKRVRKNIGERRIYSFGVGASVNRYLMDGVASEGRGYARYIDPTDDATEVAIRFASALKTPILTDVELDWGSLDVADVSPEILPDLFAGDAIRIFARYKTGGKHTVTIKGKVNGVYAELPMQIDLASTPTNGTSRALPLIWARSQIAAKTLDYNTEMGDKDALKKAVVRLGLAHSLQSQFTSFVAVSRTVYNQTPDTTETKSVALPKVAATSAAAYPSAISGSSTPEPETLLGLMLALMLAVARFGSAVRSRLARLITATKEYFNVA